MLFREIRFGSDEYWRACRLREEVLRTPLGLPLSTIDVQGESEQLHFGLFSDSGELVACVLAAVSGAHHAKIRQTAISPAYQRQGFGCRIMTELESVLVARHIRMLTLHARSTAVAFYQKLGFEVDGDEFIEVSIAHRRMIKRLA